MAMMTLQYFTRLKQTLLIKGISTATQDAESVLIRLKQTYFLTCVKCMELTSKEGLSVTHRHYYHCYIPTS